MEAPRDEEEEAAPVVAAARAALANASDAAAGVEASSEACGSPGAIPTTRNRSKVRSSGGGGGEFELEGRSDGAAAVAEPLAPAAEGTRRAPLEEEAPGVVSPPPSLLPPAALPFSLPKSLRVPSSLEPLRRRTHSR